MVKNKKKYAYGAFPGSSTKETSELHKALLQETLYEYIGDMSQQLQTLASADSQSFLAHLLSMVVEEANATARRMRLRVHRP